MLKAALEQRGVFREAVNGDQENMLSSMLIAQKYFSKELEWKDNSFLSIVEM